MKKLVVASLALGMLACGSAYAADLKVKAPVQAPPPAGFNWTGCYLGGHVGHGQGVFSTASDLRQTTTGSIYNGGGPNSIAYNASFVGGGTLGCNYEFAMNGNTGWLVGLEGEGGFLRSTNSFPWPNSPAGDTIYSSTIGDWYAVAAGRLGWVNDRVLFYVKGGAAWTHVSSSVVDVCSTAPCGGLTVNATGGINGALGFAIGGGFEWAAFGNWIVTAEGLYLDFNKSYTVCGPSGPVVVATYCGTEKLGGIILAKLGLTYKFDWAPFAPVVARY